MANIELFNIIKVYGFKPDKKNKTIPEDKRAVNDISFKIPSGSFTVLVGPSGCGKTTLLRMIAGLEDITSGLIKIGEVDITNFEPGDRGLAMVFQNYALYPHMTVRENIEFGLVNARIPRFEIKERTDESLSIVGLTDYQSRRPANLSGGQRQRVALARAIAKKPQCFLMDEPLSNLDAKLRSEMRTELIDLHNELKSTFVYVTHDQIEAMTMGTNIVVMSEGKIKQQGLPSEIYHDPQNVFVARFIGDPGMNILNLSNGNKVGFRGHDINLQDLSESDDSVIIKSQIASIENHGSDFVYGLNTCLGHIFIKELSRKSRVINSTITFSIKKDNIYFFDNEDKRIYDKNQIEVVYEAFKNSWR